MIARAASSTLAQFGKHTGVVSSRSSSCFKIVALGADAGFSAAKVSVAGKQSTPINSIGASALIKAGSFNSAERLISGSTNKALTPINSIAISKFIRRVIIGGINVRERVC